MKKFIEWIANILITFLLTLFSVYSYIFTFTRGVSPYTQATFIMIGMLFDLAALSAFVFITCRISKKIYEDDSLTKYYCEEVKSVVKDRHIYESNIFNDYSTECELENKEIVIVNGKEAYDNCQLGHKTTLYLVRGFNKKGKCIFKEVLYNKPERWFYL